MSYKPKEFADLSELLFLKGVWQVIKCPGLIKIGQKVYLPAPENTEFTGVTTDKKAGEFIGLAMETSNGENVKILLKGDFTEESFGNYRERVAGIKRLNKLEKDPPQGILT